ncbi:hypothetical protein V6N13_076672 [Hibiscus sabdariffa]
MYSVVLPTIPSEKYWKDIKMSKIDPPVPRKMLGRPKHKRKKEGEPKSKNKVHQQEDQASPPMSTPLVTPMPRQATPPMSRQTTPPMTFMSTPPAHSISTFDLGSPSAQPPIQSRSSTPTKRNVTTHRIPVCNR